MKLPRCKYCGETISAGRDFCNDIHDRRWRQGKTPKKFIGERPPAPRPRCLVTKITPQPPPSINCSSCPKVADLKYSLELSRRVCEHYMSLNAKLAAEAEIGERPRRKRKRRDDWEDV